MAAWTKDMWGERKEALSLWTSSLRDLLKGWVWGGRDKVWFCFNLSTEKYDVAIYRDRKDSVWKSFEARGNLEFGFSYF